MKVKIMSFNAQHCKNFNTKKIDYNSIINLIKDNDVDIIGLNEIFALSKNKSQVSKIANKLGYYYCFGKSTNIILPYGNGIISKFPIRNYKIINIPKIKHKTGNKHYEKRSILMVEIEINKNIYDVYITHLGLNKDEQLLGFKEILNNVKENNSIIMGDFNTIIDNNNEIKKKFKDTENYIKGNKNTYPSNNPTIKLDYILVSKNITVSNAKVLKDIISDHNPIFSEIIVK